MFNRRDGIYLFVLAFITAISSEIKIIPFFNGEAFRFGLGSITFFLLILIRKPPFLVRAGLVTGATVVCFRMVVDLLFGDTSFWTSAANHFPAFVFYTVFALSLSILKIEKYETTPLLLGALAAGSELVGNTLEHLLRYALLTEVQFNFRAWILLGAVALLRSYFAVGLYSSIIISEQKKRMQEMLSVGSELYAESLYLKKSVEHIEKITASSHDLYRKLKKDKLHELSRQALLITQEIHEVKKDSQRILAGLSKITNQQRKDIFLLSDVLHLVMTANENYSELLRKDITFKLTMAIDFETDEQIPLLALLNNIMANAVESIRSEGEIDCVIFEEMEHTCFLIRDSGEGISKGDVTVVFEPGYTTKFSNRGVAATGVGLSHVQEIIQALEGQVRIEVPEKGTVFRIRIPTENIRK